jgi:hypothetical protein
MKALKFNLLGGIILLCLSMMFASCEGTLDDVFGEWDKPAPQTSTTVAVTSISLDKATLELQVGKTSQLTATVAPDNATDKTITWSSDQEAIATVDANGLVTAKADGTATITAKAGDKSATCKVTVTPGLSTPLTLEVLKAGTIVVENSKSGMQYSLNGGARTNVPNGGAINNSDLNVGDKVEFYGTASSYHITKIMGGSAEVKVYGNIMSLVDKDNFATIYTTLPAASTFKELFDGYTNLIDASGLLLPATTLTDNCYESMFRVCVKLTKAPKLPATTLADNCYVRMFDGCTSLTTAYVKAAYTDTNSECTNMFTGCTATGAVLHTTSANQGSWSTVNSSYWSNWTAVADWND